jgi:hypothetical protein
MIPLSWRVLLLPFLALPVAAPRSVGGARVLLESAAGESKERDLAGFTCADPRELGARLVRFEGLIPPRPPASDSTRAEVTLHGGDRLFGRLRGGRAELIDLEVTGGVHLGLALDEIASLVYPERVPKLGSVAPAPPPEGDRVYRRAGSGLDVIDGGIEEFTADGVTIHGESVGTKSIAWTEIAALFVEDLGGGPPPRPSKGVPVAIDLTDGGRLRGGLESLSERGCVLLTRNHDRLTVPLEAIELLFVDDGEAAFLSSLVPAEAPPSLPFGDDLGMQWPLRVDRSVLGGRLLAGGRTHPRGLGVHAPSRVAWALDGTWKHLRAVVAVDDEARRLPTHGSVVFRVVVDGQKRFESRELHAGDVPVPTGTIDLSGARELVFEVDPSDGSTAADRADWIAPILWK